MRPHSNPVEVGRLGLQRMGKGKYEVSDLSQIAKGNKKSNEIKKNLKKSVNHCTKPQRISVEVISKEASRLQMTTTNKHYLEKKIESMNTPTGLTMS